MHRLEPFYLWRDDYVSEEDPNALNYGKSYSEFYFSHKIYNYVIHPQWDSFGSETLFYKQLYADYEKGYCIIEFIGEWNDCINNDIMFLKNELIDPLIQAGIQNFILIMENVLNFHALDNDYYIEWQEEIKGEIYLLNALPQVLDELNQNHFDQLMQYDGVLNECDWRVIKPQKLLKHIHSVLKQEEF